MPICSQTIKRISSYIYTDKLNLFAFFATKVYFRFSFCFFFLPVIVPTGVLPKRNNARLLMINKDWRLGLTFFDNYVYLCFFKKLIKSLFLNLKFFSFFFYFITNSHVWSRELYLYFLLHLFYVYLAKVYLANSLFIRIEWWFSLKHLFEGGIFFRESHSPFKKVFEGESSFDTSELSIIVNWKRVNEGWMEKV